MDKDYQIITRDTALRNIQDLIINYPAQIDARRAEYELSAGYGLSLIRFETTISDDQFNVIKNTYYYIFFIKNDNYLLLLYDMSTVLMNNTGSVSTVITRNVVSALRDGSHEAYKKIFIAYYNKIKYFINGFVKSEEAAEELAQDIFLKLWEKRESIDPEKSIGYFMYTMARNATFNFLKRKLVHNTYTTRLSFGEHFELSAEEKVYASEIALLVDMAVQKMPLKRREIYELSRYDGLTSDDIADKLNISKKTVENQLSIALKEIRKVISLFMLTICAFIEYLWMP